jgi:hypothetical protein
MAVIDCLEDPDETLKLKTLELLVTMTKANNVQVGLCLSVCVGGGALLGSYRRLALNVVLGILVLHPSSASPRLQFVLGGRGAPGGGGGHPDETLKLQTPELLVTMTKANNVQVGGISVCLRFRGGEVLRRH